MTAAAGSNKKSSNAYEFNPRWKGYVYIMLSSLINFASVSNVNERGVNEFKGSRGVSLMFGIITFAATLVILAFDNCQSCFWTHFSKRSGDGEDDIKGKKNADKYNYTKAFDGKLEGATLAFFTFWWMVGVGVITQVGGIAYSAFNIYFSSWLTLGACVYTLDEWSSAKDLLSIAELTGVSVTLKSWYLVWLSSMVAMGTAANLRSSMAERYGGNASFSVAVATISFLVSFFFILVHYRFINFKWVRLGGWFELGMAAFMVLIWTIEVGVVTQDGGIAATISGDGCRDRWGATDPNDDSLEDTVLDKQAQSIYEECYIVWRDLDSDIADHLNKEQDKVDSLTKRPGDDPTVSPSATPSTLIDEDATDMTGGQSNGISRRLDDADFSSFNGTFDDDIALLLNGTLNDTISEPDDPKATAAIIATPVPVKATRAPIQADAPLPTTGQPSRSPSDFPSAAPTFILSGVGEQIITCESVLDIQIPGSNLYLASWIAFFSSLNVTLRWKAAQALSFAQAAEEAAAEAERETSNHEEEGVADDDDDDDMSDDYLDVSSTDHNI